MILIERRRRKATEGVGERTRQCENRGCFHSARFTARFLDAYDVRLCKGCADSWQRAYDDALFGWQETA